MTNARDFKLQSRPHRERRHARAHSVPVPNRIVLRPLVPGRDCPPHLGRKESDMTTDSIADADTIVLIHGLWMTPRMWEHWIPRYERRGSA